MSTWKFYLIVGIIGLVLGLILAWVGVEAAEWQILRGG